MVKLIDKLQPLPSFLLEYLKDKNFRNNILYCNSKINFSILGITTGSQFLCNNSLYFKLQGSIYYSIPLLINTCNGSSINNFF